MLKVLVAEDEANYRELIETALRDAGYEVISAVSGTEAFKKLKEKPDMAVLDVNMPGMSGFELCEKIRQDPGAGRMPILILTVLSETRKQVQGYGAGADDYLPKPFSLEVFIARLKKLQQRILGK